MSSLYFDKFKFFSCYKCSEDNFNIYVKRHGNIKFGNDNPGISPGGNDNNIEKFDFKCDNNKIILFAVLKANCHLEILKCKDYKGFENKNLNIFYEENGFRVLEGRLIQRGGEWGGGNQFSLTNIETCSGKSLIFEEIENILFFQPNKAIENLHFDKNDYKVDSTNHTTNINEKSFSTYNIHHTEKIPAITTTATLQNYYNTEDIDEPEIISTDNNLPEKKGEIRELNMTKANITKEEIMENIEQIMNNTIIGETYEYQNEDFTILIYPTDSNVLTNKTHIDFVECESILKSHYNLSNESIITFFQMEISNKNSHSLINQVEYQVYDEQKNQLELSLCNNANIKIFYGIKNDSNLDMSIINSFKDSGVNVFNLSDEFFNDICYPYSENGNDLILEDRIKEIYQNFSLCEEGCTYDAIDIYNMLISCKCNVKENMTTVISEIEEEAAEKITSLNFEIIKCYNLVFSFKGKMNNIGFWILSICLLLYILSLFIYCYKGMKPVKDYIFNEMTKYGYINKNKSIKSNKTNRKSMQKRKRGNINYPPIKKGKDKFSKGTSVSGNALKSQRKKSSIINNINLSAQININKENSKENNIKNLDLNLISINLNDLSSRNISPKESNITLYNYTMEEAFKYDRRNILVIFYIYLLSKQPFFHAFLYRSPLVIFPLRFCLLLFIISSDLALNALFYFNDNISRKYRYTKSIFIFAVSNNITVILLSTLVGFILLTLFTNLSNSTKAIRDVFKNEEKKIRKNKNYKITQKRKDEIKKIIENILNKHKYKLIILFAFEILLMIFFWYYVVAFCHVFSGTQTSWLIDSVLSMISRFIIDLLFCLLFAKIYRIGVASNYECIYKFALFFYGFC